MNKVVTIRDKQIGNGEDVFVVFELGVCHEQNVELAEQLIEAAAKAGADAVKTEAFQADEILADKTITTKYTTADGPVEENYYDLLKRLELSYDDLHRLKKKADEVGILFFSTVHNTKSVDFMDSINVCAFKLASPDIIHHPLLRHIATKNRPVFLDTGGAFIGEVEAAVDVLRHAGANDVLVMHNPSGYPAPPEKTDLRMMSTLKNVLEIPVGLSCHTPGLDVVMGAVAVGADIIEKPISRDQNIASPEHIFSFLKEDAESVVQRIRNMKIAMGEQRRMIVDEQSLPRFIGRRGLYATRDINPGETIEQDDVFFGKPLKGIPVNFVDQALGRKASVKILKHQPITWESL
jgi:N,N'-diacetyllegionaminate synthase